MRHGSFYMTKHKTLFHNLKKAGEAIGVAIALASFPVSAEAPRDIRVALVIGNSAYAVSPLLNPVNDARAMSEALRGLGFSVIELRDAQKNQMAEAVAKMHDTLKGKQGIGMLYYAGHGVQYDWRNFMVPVDARLKHETDIPIQTVDVGIVLDAFKEAGNRFNLLVLDACRDNPFDNKLATKGLAPMNAPPGTYMAFATAAGNVAEDGDEASGNGLYTQFLLQELKKPAARVEDVFKRVKLQVRQKSQGRQIPTESSNFDEEFSFDKGFAKSSIENESVRLARYNAEKAAWDGIKSSQSADDFFAFLQRYPNGFISEIAQFRADQLKKPLLVAQLARDAVATLASGSNRFAVGDQYILITTDLLTQKVRREPQRVTSATNDRVEINGGATVYDQMGGLIKDDSGVKDPPMLLVPADIALNKKWRSSFQNRILGFNARTYVDFKAVAVEDLDVAGARFKVFRVEMEGYASANGIPASINGTIWIEPKTMRMVRYDREVRVSSHLVDATRIEVADYKPADRF